MWSILKIYMGLVFITIYVHGINDRIIDWIWHYYTPPHIVHNAVQKGKWIDGIFKPDNDIHIGYDGFSLTFRGKNMIDNSDVVMKEYYFRQSKKNEYEMYSYLEAIDYVNENCEVKKCEAEKYGISRLLYYHSVTVLPLYECYLWKMRFESNTEFKEIDYLILFRDFILQSKYMHKHGIRHDYVNAHNIMIHKGRSFLIDFVLSSKLDDPFISEKFVLKWWQQFKGDDFIEITNLLKSKMLPFDDWGSFFHTMAMIVDVDLTWFNAINGYSRLKTMCTEMKEHPGHGLEGVCSKMIRESKNSGDIITQIENQIRANVTNEHLREVMVAFAKEAFKTSDSFPNYDGLENLIMEKIDIVKEPNDPVVFSWLKGDALKVALNELNTNPPATAKELGELKMDFQYDEPRYYHFLEMMHAMGKKAKKNYERRLKEERKNEKAEKINGKRSICSYFVDCIPHKHNNYMNVGEEEKM